MQTREAERRLLRVPEAADLMGVSRTTLYMWISRGIVPVVRVNGARVTRIDPADLDRFIEANKVGRTGAQ